jgi:uncharacterized protein (DUF1778 family)
MSTSHQIERIEMRIPASNKHNLLRAAALRGQSLTDFVLQAALESAVQTIEKHEVIALNKATSSVFYELLQNPPKPNAALKKAALGYAKRHG